MACNRHGARFWDAKVVRKISDGDKMIGFRHLPVHACRDFDHALLWQMVRNDFARLRREVGLLCDKLNTHLTPESVESYTICR